VDTRCGYAGTSGDRERQDQRQHECPSQADHFGKAADERRSGEQADVARPGHPGDPARRPVRVSTAGRGHQQREGAGQARSEQGEAQDGSRRLATQQAQAQARRGKEAAAAHEHRRPEADVQPVPGEPAECHGDAERRVTERRQPGRRAEIVVQVDRAPPLGGTLSQEGAGRQDRHEQQRRCPRPQELANPAAPGRRDGRDRGGPVPSRIGN